MRSILLATLAIWTLGAPAFAAFKPPHALDELRQDARRIADRAGEAIVEGEARRMNSAVAVPTWSDLRGTLKAKCDETTVRYWTYWGDVMAGLREPTHGVPLSSGAMQRDFPLNIIDISKTLPPPGKALFLRADETLNAKPSDWPMAARQRAEWTKLIGALTDGIVTQESAADYGANYALGLWARLECDVAKDNTRFLEAYAKAAPSEAGEDTARALAALQAN